MFLPQLHILTHNDKRRAKPLRKVKILEKWVTELPIGNTTVAAHHMLEQLRGLNAAKIHYKERINLQNCLRPVFEELLHAIRQPLRQLNLPLERRHQYTIELIEKLQEEMACGYKLIVSELVMHNQLKEFDRLLLQEAIYLSIVYLSKRLMDAYTLYITEPAHVWHDLNQLYEYAEAQHIHTETIDDPIFDNTIHVVHTIEIAYKRIIMLRLSEPYHLMQFEAEDIYRIVASCAKDCHLEPLTEIVTKGEYIIHFNQDSGPRFTIQNMANETEHTRLIDISLVKQQLNAQLEALLKANAHNAAIEVVSLVERQQRDMLLRLADAWNATLIRKTERFVLDTQVDLTTGLNAGHHYISHELEFSPEMDELKLITHTERRPHEEELRSMFAESYRDSLQKDRIHLNQTYVLSDWWQRNISPVGIALDRIDENIEIDVRVGELVTYRLNARKHKRWQLGSIRWFKHKISDDDEQAGLVTIGVMNLATGAKPIAVKALQGLGEGTDYFRALLVPKQVSIKQIRSLIVPALLYDVGTVLAVNMADKLFYARLTRMITSTRSFTQFDFEIVNRPTELLF